MKKTPYTTKSGLKQFKPMMSEETYQAESGEYSGFCLACGSTQGNCEPDARKYVCESCNAEKVYGLEELMMMGLVKLTGLD